MPTRVELPDGTFVVIPDDASEEDLNEFKSILRERFPEETVLEDPGLGSRTVSSLQRGFEDLGGAYKSIFKIGLTTDDEKIQKRAINLKLKRASQEERLGTQTTFRDVKDRWTTDTPDEYARGAGETIMDYVVETTASSLPQMGVGVAGGLSAAALAAPIPIPGARIVAFGIGYAMASVPYFFGKNLERQVDEGRVTAEDINTIGAFGTGLGQSAIDSALFVFTGGAGKAAKTTAIRAVTEGLLKGAAKGIPIEGTTEVLQTALERFQAGLPLRPEDEQAVWEYIEAGVGGAAAGGPIGAISQAGSDYVAVRGLAKKDLTVEEGKENKELDDINIINEDYSEDIKINEQELTGEEPGPIKSKIAPGHIENSIPLDPTQKVYDVEQGKERETEFEDIPLNSKVRLPFYRTEEIVNDEGERSINYVPLIDPKTNRPVTKDYDIDVFMDEETGVADSGKLDLIEVEFDGQVYKPMWKNPGATTEVKSRAFVNMDTNNPLNAVDASINRDFSLKEILNIIRGKDYADFKNVPEGATEKDIIDNVQAKKGIDFILGKGRRFFKADRGLDSELFNTILGNRYLNRSVVKQMRDVATRVNNSVEKLLNSKRAFFAGPKKKGYEHLSGYINELLDKYVSGETEINGNKILKELKDLGVDSKSLNLLRDTRKLVDKQSEAILDLMNELDPDQKRWGPEIKKSIEKRMGSYLTVAYGLNVDPTYRPPDRTIFDLAAPIRFKIPFTDKEITISGPTKLEREQHEAAVNKLKEIYLKSGREKTPDSAEVLAREVLGKVYRKQMSVTEMVKGMDTSQKESEASVKEDDADTDIFMDRGILKKLGNIPTEIKQVIGEINNPLSRLTYTAIKQAELISNVKTMQTLFELASDPEARQISPVASGNFNTRIELPEDPFNPFNGQYTTREFAEALSEVTGNYLLSGFDKITNTPLYVYAVLKPKNIVQRFKLIYSPSTQLRNIESAIGFVLVNGNMNFKTWKDIKRIMKSPGFRNMINEDTAMLSDLGVFNTGVFAGEIASAAELAGNSQSPINYVASIDKFLHPSKKNMFQKVGKIWRKAISDPFTKSYQYGDDVWKAFAFRSEYLMFSKTFDIKRPKSDDFNYTARTNAGKQNEWEQSAEYAEIVDAYIDVIKQLMFGEKFIRGLTESTPKGRLNQAIEELAAYRVRNNMPNYDFVAPFTELLRKSPVGNFTSFPTEQVRTTVNVAYSGQREVNTGSILKEQAEQIKDTDKTKAELFNYAGSRLKRRGYVRNMSLAAYIASLQVTIPTFAALKLGLYSTGAGGLSVLAAGSLAAFLPEWEAEDNIIPYGYNKETGELYYANASNSDAYDVVAAPFRTTFLAMARGARDGDPKQALDGVAKSLSTFLKPYVSPSIWTQVSLDLTFNRKSSTGGKIYNETDTTFQKVNKLIEYGFNVVQPGVIPQAERLSQSLFSENIEDKYNKYGRRLDELETISRVSGLTINTINFKENFAEFLLSDFKRKKASIFSADRVESYAEGKYLKDVDRLIESYKDANTKYYNLVNEVREKQIQVGDYIYLKPEDFREAIDDQGRTIDRIDSGNLFDNETFEPKEPKDFYSEVKERFIETLKGDFEGEELDAAIKRLEAVEYPQEAFDNAYDEFSELPLYKYILREDPNPEQKKKFLFEGQEVTQEDLKD